MTIREEKHKWSGKRTMTTRIALKPMNKTYEGDLLRIEIKRGYVYFNAFIDETGNVFKISKSLLMDKLKTRED